MLRGKPRNFFVVLKDTRQAQVRSTEAEVDRWLSGAHDELGEIIAGTEPCENSLTFPAPWDNLFASDVGAEMPPMFLGVVFNAAVNAVIVPAQCQKNSLLPWHRIDDERSVQGFQAKESSGGKVQRAPRCAPIDGNWRIVGDDVRGPFGNT